VEVNGQVVSVVTTTTVVMAVDSAGGVTDGVSTAEVPAAEVSVEDVSPDEVSTTEDEDAPEFSDVVEVEGTSVVAGAELDGRVTNPELLGMAMVLEFP
jgi:hypothetical protein